MRKALFLVVLAFLPLPAFADTNFQSYVNDNRPYCSQYQLQLAMINFFSGSVGRMPKIRDADELIKYYGNDLKVSNSAAREGLSALITLINDFNSRLENKTEQEQEAYVAILDFNQLLQDLISGSAY